MAYRLLQTVRKVENQILASTRNCAILDKSRVSKLCLFTLKSVKLITNCHLNIFYYLQYYHIQQNPNSIHSILTRWLQFSDSAPKGFGKFFNKDGPNSKKSKDIDSSSNKSNESASDTSSAKDTTGSEQTNKRKSDKPFKFEFKKSSSGGGGGGGGGGSFSNKEKIFLALGLAIGGLIGVFAFNEMVYEEISWHDFVNR